MKILGKCMCAWLLMSVATLLYAAANIEINDSSYTLQLTSCSVNPDYYFINASSDSFSLSVVGAPAGDSPYTTIDFFYTKEGQDLRASTSTKFIALTNKVFDFQGEVDVSDGTKKTMKLSIEGCD